MMNKHLAVSVTAFIMFDVFNMSFCRYKL